MYKILVILFTIQIFAHINIFDCIYIILVELLSVDMLIEIYITCVLLLFFTLVISNLLTI